MASPGNTDCVLSDGIQCTEVEMRGVSHYQTVSKNMDRSFKVMRGAID